MDCYTCKHRRQVSGSAHSSCSHDVAETYKPIAFLVAARGRGNTHPLGKVEVEGKPLFELDEVGVRNGWALWPIDYDPTWVKHCLMYDQRDTDPGDRNNERIFP